MFQLALNSPSIFKPLLLQLPKVAAFSLVSLCAWSLISSIVDVIAQGKRMHQIPCTKCRFFTGDYRLKCTVNPSLANTEEAIGCRDYRHQNQLNF